MEHFFKPSYQELRSLKTQHEINWNKIEGNWSNCFLRNVNKEICLKPIDGAMHEQLRPHWFSFLRETKISKFFQNIKKTELLQNAKKL